MRLALLLTLLAVVIATLAECRPFSDYWAVLPTPPAQCRQGYAQLLTASISNALTDLLLIVFPVPIIASTSLKLSRKILLMLLFCLGVFNIVVGIYRVPVILREGGYQGTRTTWASVEIVVAVFVANALALGSFVRDTGAKKKKRFKGGEGQYFSSSGLSTLKSADRGRGAVKAGIVAVSEETAVGSTTASVAVGGKMGKDKSVASRSASRDSLIPRGGRGKQLSAEEAQVEGTGLVMKTTTIEVTVTEGGEGDGGDTGGREAAERKRLAPMARPRVVHSASGRGKARGSTIILQELEPVPGRGSPRAVGAYSC